MYRIASLWTKPADYFRTNPHPPSEGGQPIPAASRPPVRVLHDSGQWLYKDQQGVMEGPYKTKQMLFWMSKGFFPPTLEITQPDWEEKQLYPIESLWDDPADYFKSPPRVLDIDDALLHTEWFYQDEEEHAIQGPFNWARSGNFL